MLKEGNEGKGRNEWMKIAEFSALNEIASGLSTLADMVAARANRPLTAERRDKSSFVRASFVPARVKGLLEQFARANLFLLERTWTLPGEKGG